VQSIKGAIDMRRLKTIVVAIVAVAAMSAVMSSSAFAVALPEFSVQTNAKATFNESLLEVISSLLGKITSTKGTAELTATSKTLGAVHVMFEGAKCSNGLEEGPAESLGDEKEIILVLGEYHLVRLSSGDVGVWLLIKPVHIDCLFKSGDLLVTVEEGNLLGLITPILTKTKTFELLLQQSKGKQTIKEYENDAGVKVKAGGLKTSIDEKAAVESAQETKGTKITTAAETTIEKTT
jgi:hypothetical protein